MARYSRNNSGSGFLVILVSIVCSLAVFLGVVFHAEIGAWAKKLKEKLTDDKKQEQVDDTGKKDDGADDGEAVKEDWKDFYFERQSVRYGSWSSSVDFHTRYVFSEEKYQELVNDENSFITRMYVSYSDMKKGLEKYGTIEKYFDNYYSTRTASLDSLLSDRLNRLPERYVDNYGNIKYLYSVYGLDLFKDYSNLNTRQVAIGTIATKGEDGTYSFEVMSLQPGQSYESWDVMASPVYLASKYLNAVACAEELFNSEVVRECREAISKGVAQAKGVAESAYVTGDHTLAVDTSEKLQLKVGETKQLVVPFTPNIGVQIVYNTLFGDLEENYDYVTVTESGAVTAKKAGTCYIPVEICGIRYDFEVEITR